MPQILNDVIGYGLSLLADGAETTARHPKARSRTTVTDRTLEHSAPVIAECVVFVLP